jgi:hypothetical protein
MLTYKELSKVIKLKIEIVNLLQSNKRGNGLLIKKTIDNLNLIEKYLRSIASLNYRKKEFYILCLLPYIIDGNKFIYRFNEFYKLISKYSFPIDDDSILLFRCMSLDEFESFKVNGNQTPSWTNVLTSMERWASIKIVTNECDECVIIAAEYSKKDIISDTNYDTEKTYGINDEFEYFIKKSSKPITYFELNNYDIDWFEEKFGCNIDDATISPKESENGYRWFDIVSSKIDLNLKSPIELKEEFEIQMKKSISKIKEYSKYYPKIAEMEFRVNSGDVYTPLKVCANNFNLN